MSILYLLGSGASVDSGLFTYRGPDGLYENLDNYEESLSYNNYIKNPEIFWNNYLPLYENILRVFPGPTYQKIKEMIKEKDYILTQNLDKLAHSCTKNCLDLHGIYDETRCISCRNIEKVDLDKILLKNYKCQCEGLIRPNFTMFGENLNENTVNIIFRVIKTKPKYCIVTGTTLQFSYLENILNKLKSKGTIIIYIDPDISFLMDVRKKCKRRYGSKVFICAKSYEGLCYVDKILKNGENFVRNGDVVYL
uniref:Deacetylase sirtuin-type domain-containing protein n=1 Tax=viral metagenome TaxID=1070528 RepID=A0A6C0AEM7_9ZZZZ